jgi:hypothetical protein
LAQFVALDRGLVCRQSLRESTPFRGAKGGEQANERAALRFGRLTPERLTD